MPDQLDLFNRPAKELARSSDPITSKLAAAIGHGRDSMRRRIARTFLDGPLTYEGAAEAAELDLWAASRRVSDLVKAGALEPTGRLLKGSTGRLQRELRLTDRGRAALEAVR